MSKITIDRAVVEQALEAFNVATTPLARDRQEVLKAVEALRAALEQPQPPRHPLTDEQITALADAHMEAFAQFVGAGQVWFEGEKEFARAIEAAHGIKEQK